MMGQAEIEMVHANGMDDEKALALLGAALVLRWPLVSDDLRGELLATADRIVGVPHVAEAKERILRLIDRHAELDAMDAPASASADQRCRAHFQWTPHGERPKSAMR